MSIAHVLNNDGLIINTIVVDNINDPLWVTYGLILVDAEYYGGQIGDSIINGVLIPKPPEIIPT